MPPLLPTTSSSVGELSSASSHACHCVLAAEMMGRPPMVSGAAPGGAVWPRFDFEERAFGPLGGCRGAASTALGHPPSPFCCWN